MDLLHYEMRYVFICDDSISSNIRLPSFEDSSPRALIQKSITEFNSSAPPLMASFSLTGPNVITPNILKVNYKVLSIAASPSAVDTQYSSL